MIPSHIALSVIVMAVWASNIVAARYAVLEMPGWLVITVRMAVLAAPLIPFVRFPRAHLGRIFALSITMGTGHFGLMFVALQRVDAGAAALLIQTAVPFAALLAWILYREPLGWLRAAGITGAFAGVALLVGGPDAPAGVPLSGAALILASAFFFAIANIQLRGLGGVNVFAVNGWMAVFAVPQMAILSLLLEDNQIAALSDISLPAVLAILHMSIVVSLLGHGLWYHLVPKYRTNQTMPLTLLIPVFGVTFGIVLLDEAVTWRVFVGGLVTIAGVATVMFDGARKGEGREQQAAP